MRILLCAVAGWLFRNANYDECGRKLRVLTSATKTNALTSVRDYSKGSQTAPIRIVPKMARLLLPTSSSA